MYGIERDFFAVSSPLPSPGTPFAGKAFAGDGYLYGQPAFSDAVRVNFDYVAVSSLPTAIAYFKGKVEVTGDCDKSGFNI
jgi:hypothetical protein